MARVEEYYHVQIAGWDLLLTDADVDAARCVPSDAGSRSLRCRDRQHVLVPAHTSPSRPCILRQCPSTHPGTRRDIRWPEECEAARGSGCR